jgi:subtilisin family serine protease
MIRKRPPAPLKTLLCAFLALSIAGPAWAESTSFTSSQKMEFAANMPGAKPQEVKGLQKTVVVKLAKTTSGAARLGSGDSETAKQWKELATRFPGAAFEPYFSTSESSLRSLSRGKAGGEDFGGDDIRLWSYVRINVPEGTDPAEIVKAVSGWSSVETAYVEAGPVPPPLVNSSDDPMSGEQGYLGAAPEGIDARFAWDKADGSGVLFVDVEQGWVFNHRDLKRAKVTLISGENAAYHGHGTAVLGEVVGVDNKIGVIGIAPKATARVVSQYRTMSNYSTAEAIVSAAAVMSAGDVMLLEAQTTIGSSEIMLPVEVYPAEFDAIAAATRKGIIVIEAAGNGSADLDKARDAIGKLSLNRKSSDFRDSGAIMIGAASSIHPHTRMSFSNYGSRIDCFGWGENVATTSDGWQSQDPTIYTSTFSGTSSASPIVTGAALLLQSWAKQQGKIYSPKEMRALLCNKKINTRSKSPKTDRIGVLPNLKNIIQSEEGMELSLPASAELDE